MHKIIWAAALFLTVLAGQALAQSELQQLSDKLAETVRAINPEWRESRGGGAHAAEDVVVVESWSFSHRRVSVSIVRHSSVAEAQAALQKFMLYEQDKKQISDLGDEAWGRGMYGADIALRKGRFTVYVRASADVDADPDARTLSATAKEARRKTEHLRLSQEFTGYLRTALGP